jgi:hypothetical protein
MPTCNERGPVVRTRWRIAATSDRRIPPSAEYPGERRRRSLVASPAVADILEVTSGSRRDRAWARSGHGAPGAAEPVPQLQEAACNSTINGKRIEATFYVRTSLLDPLRDRLGLTGSKNGLL